MVRAAEPIERPALRVPSPPNAGDYSVAAVDGSQIELDPHAPVFCYLLNYGVAIFRYQQDSDAWLFSRTELGFRPEDLALRVEDRTVVLNGQLLGIRRQLGEAELLAQVGETDGRFSSPKLALQDGAMRLGLVEGPGIDQKIRDGLTRRHLQSLERFRESKTPVASYVSRPRSSDVVNALRLWLRDFGSDETNRTRTELTMEDFEGIYDRDIFGRTLLEKGDRSAIFCSSWRTSREKYGKNRIHFVYLKAGDEIARIDLPEWVAIDANALNFVHSAIVDQIDKGLGYPVSLTEAHEQAAVRSADRRMFWDVVEQMAGEAGLSIVQSAKASLKSLRPA